MGNTHVINVTRTYFADHVDHKVWRNYLHVSSVPPLGARRATVDAPARRASQKSSTAPMLNKVDWCSEHIEPLTPACQQDSYLSVHLQTVKAQTTNAHAANSGKKVAMERSHVYHV